MYRPTRRLLLTATPEGGDPAGGGGPVTPAAPTPQPPTPTAPPAGEQPKGDEDEPLGPAGKKALIAERERAEAAERELAALRREIEDGKKTAEQRAAEEREALQRAAAENAAKALRYEVAAEKGLDLKLAPRLTGTTREELEADAEALMALIPRAEPTPEPTPTPGQPVPTIAKTPPTPGSGNVSLDAQIAAAEKAGDYALAGSLKAMKLAQSA